MADTDQPKAELVVETRVDGAIKPFDQVVEAAQRMGRKVGEAADTAAKGVDGIGAGAAAGADKMDKATRSIAASIQRSIAVTKAGERGTADFYTALADVKGIDKKALAPYIEQLRQVEIAQKASITSLSNMGLTAKQTKAALQQVPAQFTDIITSLQGGQAPMTVLLQQGGQLKDVFGGAGAAAKALGGYIAGLVTPYTVAAAAAGGIAFAFSAGREESAAYAKALILTGNAAGVTAGQLSAMAQAIDKTAFGVTQGKAAEVIAAIASSAVYGAANIRLMAQAAIEMERAGGPAATETAKAFAELAKAPLQASIKLNEAQNYLTRSTYEQIKALEEQGRHVEAARVAQEAFANATIDRAPQMVDQLGYVERAWKGVSGAVAEAWDKMKDIGRDGGTVGALREAESKIGPGRRRTYVGEMENLAALEQGAKYEALSAAYTAEQAKQVKLLAEYRKDDAKYLKPLAQYQREVTQAVNEGIAAQASAEEIQLRVAAANKKYNDSFKNGAGSANRELEAENDLMAKLSGLTTTYNNDIQRLNNLRARGVLSEERYAKAVQELVSAQPYMVRYTRELTEAERARNKELEDATKVRDRYAEGIETSIAGAAKETQSLQDQLVQLSMGKEALNERIALRLEDQALAADSAARWTAVTEIEAEGYRRLAEQLRATARARRELTQGQIEKDLLDANKKAADRALREWERAADQIGANLADALIEGGDSAAKYIERLFKNMVLQPIVQAAIQPFVNAGIGAIGGGASGLGSTVGAAAGLGSLGAFGAFGTAFGMGSALTGAGGIGTALGASGTMIGAGNYAGGFGMGAGALAGPAAIAAIYANVASSAYDDGFRRNQARNVINPAGGALLGGIGGLYGSLSADVATGLSKLGLSDKWADILSGATAWAKTFGRAAPKVTSQGISGSIGGGDFTGSAFADIVEKGGIFRSDKKYTKTSALPEEIGRMLDESAKSLLDKAQDYGAALGLPVESLGNLSKNIKIVLGKDAAANQEAILASLSTYGDTLVAAWADALKPVAEYGETTAETVSRVAESLTVINAVLKQLGLTSLEASVTGGKAAVELGNAFGGLDALQQSSKSYYESFYSDSERAAKATQSVTEALAAVGLALPSTKDQFRDLVEAADLTTEAGRTQYATLLGVADVFSQITDSGKDLIKAGEGVAEYIAELRGASTKGGSLAAARATYATDLASAKAGDVSATSRIVSDAKALVEAVRQAATDPIALARETSRIAAELQSLPAMQAYLSQVPAASAAQPTPQASVSPSASVAQSSQQASSFSVDSIVTELQANRTAIETVALNTGKTVKILDRLTVDGNAIEWVST